MIRSSVLGGLVIWISDSMFSNALDFLIEISRVYRHQNPTLSMDTLKFGLRYKKNENFTLIRYFDIDYDGDQLDRKSTTSLVVFLAGNLMTWTSLKQRVVNLSSGEVEYIVLSVVACHSVWLAGLIEELTKQKMTPP